VPTRPGLPYVVVHVAVSLDGATTGFEPDAERFYRLARTWAEDVTLVGADTILAQEATLVDAPRPGPAQDGPLLAVVDGRARVHQWEALRTVGHWSGVVALRCHPLARADDPAVEEIVVGTGRVDLAGALRTLAARPGADVVRVDSGGALTGALLAQGLVDEVSLLVHPLLVGPGHGRRWHGDAAVPVARLSLLHSAALEGLVWLRYSLREELPTRLRRAPSGTVASPTDPSPWTCRGRSGPR
jgi:2,5-diamino-6-(ribosylamino)-4(3H)-pyrimidinone 5'-phosphate reductase